MSEWLKGLNPEQREAALHERGPLLILAGAGSGKTTVLVGRTGQLIETEVAAPSRIAVLTFTNKAARELKQRVGDKLGKRARGVWAGTFHSFGLDLLRKFHREAGLGREFGVLDASDAGAISKELLKDFSYAGKVSYDAERLLSMMSRWREFGQTAAQKDDEYEAAVEWLLPRYLKRLEMLGMVDFDSLILKPIELLKSSEMIRDAICSAFDQVMVDEFQDTNQMQMKMIELLCAPHRNLTVVGDDDQSIYAWRGACVANILDFPKRYSDCKVVRLERNYRCSPSILDLANSIISKNAKRHPKTLRPRDGVEPGDLPELILYENEDEESESVATDVHRWISLGTPKREIALLYRSNSQGAFVEAELRRQNIPYSMTGGTAFFDRKETRDALAYLRCSLRPNEVALRRILNTPSRGIGDKSVETLTAFARSSHLKFYEAVGRWREAGVDERSGAEIEVFLDQLKGLPDRLLKVGPGETSAQAFLQFFTDLGYKRHIEKMAPNVMVGAKRWRILEVFSGILERYLEAGGRTEKALRGFVDAMELRDAFEEKKEKEDRVQLMTLHACKGLEFRVVFLMGLEEDLLPHKMLGSDVSEERRLFYVGVTRAKEQLILTRTKKRRRHGKWVDVAPSRFLLELPPGKLREKDSQVPVREEHRRAMVDELFKKLDALGAKSL